MSVPRCADFVIGILAILKAGGAYLPLDPSYPVDRLAYMAQDAKLAHLLATRETAGKFADALPLVTLMDGDAEGLSTCQDSDPPGTAKPGDLMYVIYTSGSTGKPKGVMVSHANVTRLFPASSDHLSFGPTDVWSQVHAYSFGFSVWETWGPLLHGGRLAILPDDTVKSPEMLFDSVCREGVTVLSATPLVIPPNGLGGRIHKHSTSLAASLCHIQRRASAGRTVAPLVHAPRGGCALAG